jgi:hypothetical protein
VDQMSIPYLYHSNNMLDISKKIHTRAWMIDMKCVTLASTVTANGKMLHCSSFSKVSQMDTLQCIVTYPDMQKYWIQFHEWIDVILQSWKEHLDANNPPVDPLIIILDAYSMHQMDSAVNSIQPMGIEVVHNPLDALTCASP